MNSEIKTAKNGNDFLRFRYGNHTIRIFENQKDLINAILNEINIIDNEGIADLKYLQSKLTTDNAESFFKCWINS